MNLRYQFWERAIRSLAHPISIGAVFLLLVNDHWLRWNYPSWWTGKIGDFLWLIFAPFLAVLVLNCVFPTNKLRYIGITSFISVGLVFVLGNTIVAVHETIVWLFGLIVGWKPLMYRDPTDLLMLPGLIVGWKIWRTNKMAEQFKIRLFPKYIIGWVMLSIGALGTLANGPSYNDYGVYCVIQQDGKLQAGTGGAFADAWYVYQSDDGGLTWTRVEQRTPKSVQPCKKEAIPWRIVDPSNENILFRIRETGAFIEQSYDAGKTWVTLYEFPAGEQVRKYYYRPTPQNFGPVGRVINPGGPYNGVIDEVTGNLIVGMGFEGVVIVTPEGEVIRAAVGSYAFADIHQMSLQDRLFNELTLALWLACLIVAILSIPFWPTSGWKVIVIISATFWLLVSLFFKESGLVDFVYRLFVYFFVWLIYPILAIVGGIKIIQKHSWSLISLVFGTAVISGTLFMIPFLFWATGKTPSYQMAMVFGIITILLPIFYSYRHIRYQYHA